VKNARSYLDRRTTSHHITSHHITSHHITSRRITSTSLAPQSNARRPDVEVDRVKIQGIPADSFRTTGGARVQRVRGIPARENVADVCGRVYPACEGAPARGLAAPAGMVNS